ncbi:3'(2'),5'-bisphosphate nucleotidase CysQ [Fervidibacillus albus]|uniref:3'(2'),5'-bisphosphate nucleotidase CysQ n=1 Tax=Fervidibacillus albus TaxID=2980026 RepID=A0A9E8RVX5_9BACI|nr:3'(2'),5'-bisphosphate nucleotidase CysQ [Fervidibacillus albus]WAA09719.1 3'(2'),5'-bisphosphate nucleotidase CysQ [Fervidibacillus albus]
MLEHIQLIDLLKISLVAGKEILQVYENDFDVESKEDQSPLTLADKKSHELIVEELGSLYSDIPVLSEEGKFIPYDIRKEWNNLWLVDPLDGTKEFIKKNGEFTVNIALISGGNPVVGMIYAPVLDTAYFAKKGVGSFKLEKASAVEVQDDGELVNSSVKLPQLTKREKVSVVASRSHLSSETEEYINQIKEKYGEVKITSAGSSLKLCLVAEGIADVYPRFAPTMEWDTAAGQAIVEQTNGRVVKDDGEPLTYNKENLLNPWFIAMKKDFLT